MWQKKWDEPEKGRTTHKYFGNIKRRMEMKHIKINHNTAQFITGHGYFNSKLHKFGLSDTELCKCDLPTHQNMSYSSAKKKKQTGEFWCKS